MVIAISWTPNINDINVMTIPMLKRPNQWLSLHSEYWYHFFSWRLINLQIQEIMFTIVANQLSVIVPASYLNVQEISERPYWTCVTLKRYSRFTVDMPLRSHEDWHHLGLGKCRNETISKSWLAEKKCLFHTFRPAGLLDKIDSIFFQKVFEIHLVYRDSPKALI